MDKLSALATAMLLITSCSRHEAAKTGWAANNRAFQQVTGEPRRAATVDPRSTRAAEELVDAFAALLNSGRLEDAYMLLGPDAPSRASFSAALKPLHDLQVTVHAAGDQEGAAGSTYVTVPLTFSGTSNGRRVSNEGRALLRRVNDVPGSTEAQRHWHIERVAFDR